MGVEAVKNPTDAVYALRAYAITAGWLTVGCAVPTVSDAEESSKVIKGLLSRYSFRFMSSHDRRPAVYSKPHPRYSEVVVFGDYSRNEQDEICGITRAVRHEVATEPVRIRFYRQVSDRSELLREDVFP
jgi:hypothetical protein